MKSVVIAAWRGRFGRARVAALPLLLAGAVLAGCSSTLPGGMFGKDENAPIQTQPGEGGKIGRAHV